MDRVYPEHVARRRSVVADALHAARDALLATGLDADRVYYLYVPDGADVAVTRTLDVRDLSEFANRADIRGLPNMIVRQADESTQPIGPVADCP